MKASDIVKKYHYSDNKQKFINEIVDTSENKSASSKKKTEVYKLVEENIHNI